MNGSSAPATAPVPAQDILAVDNSTLQSNGDMGAPVSSSGFLGAPQPLANGVLEGSEPEPQPALAPIAAPAATSSTASRSAALALVGLWCRLAQLMTLRALNSWRRVWDRNMAFPAPSRTLAIMSIVFSSADLIIAPTPLRYSSV